MTTHDLKCQPPWFAEVAAGRKTCEIRRDDRGFEVGDVLVLREWQDRIGIRVSGDEYRFVDAHYTGRTCRVRVTHILRGFAGLRDGYCALSVRLEEGERS